MKKALLMQDLCGMGQCSLSVSMPVLSAYGVECVALPTALLSTHSVGFVGYTRRELAVEAEEAVAHYERMRVRFDCILSSYLSGTRQLELLGSLRGRLLKEGGLFVLDPAMADYGKLYDGYDGAYVQSLAELALQCDVLLPNVSEASLLVGEKCAESADEAYATHLLKALAAKGVNRTLLKGVRFEDGQTGAMLSDGGNIAAFKHPHVPRACHGAGDVLAAVFTGELLVGRDIFEAAEFAAQFTYRAIESTPAEHWYGLNFEGKIGEIAARLRRSPDRAAK